MAPEPQSVGALPTPAPPLWQRLLPVGLALAIGAVGGAIFDWLRLPLPWMLGSMSAVTVAALCRLDVKVPRPMRNGTTPVIGVLLGASFTPDVVAGMIQWPLTLLGIMLWVLVCGGGAYLWFRHVAGYDTSTAYFSSMPGGFMEMVLIAERQGGNMQILPLIHATRVLIVVFAIPFWYRFTTDIGSAAPAARVGLFDVRPLDYLMLVFCAAAGAFLARRLKIPAALLIGPMVFSAALHLAEFTKSSPPFLLVAIAQVVLGSMIGTRFAGASLWKLRAVAGHAALMAAFMLTMTVLFANALAALTGFPSAAVVLAFAPGGLAEMSLIALALQVDAAFVAGHHALRLGFVLVSALPLFRWVSRRDKASG
ncbi:MAG: AbrB family transcriptional regulator [Alphaproteobacteria bacterium]|nr:AbrB family transcriptional regulator [Alphaproteobacteria bacterium]